jgi:hypothetical protein
MGLCRLTDKLNEGKPVFVNPREVIVVQQIGDETWIMTTGMNANGTSYAVVVTESLEEAVLRLDNAAQR